jgi:hypothetical protein
MNNLLTFKVQTLIAISLGLLATNFVMCVAASVITFQITKAAMTPNIATLCPQRANNTPVKTNFKPYKPKLGGKTMMDY